MLYNKPDYHHSFEIKTTKGYTVINTGSIVFIKAFGKYSVIHMIDSSIIISYHMLKWYRSILIEPLFIRNHNSYIINSDFVDYYSRFTITMVTKAKIPVSRNKLKQFKHEFLRAKEFS